MTQDLATQAAAAAQSDSPELANAELEARVDHGCARILRRNAIPSIVTNMVLSALVAVVAWVHGHETTAFGWFALAMVVNVVRFVVSRGFDAGADPASKKVQN